MVQAIDRLRLIHSVQKKTVVILCNIPLDIAVDELVTWKELVGMDGWRRRWRSVKTRAGERSPWHPVTSVNGRTSDICIWWTHVTIRTP